MGIERADGNILFQRADGFREPPGTDERNGFRIEDALFSGLELSAFPQQAGVS